MNENLNNKICPNCGTNNVANTNFCVGCGKQLKIETLDDVVYSNNIQSIVEVNNIAKENVTSEINQNIEVPLNNINNNQVKDDGINTLNQQYINERFNQSNINKQKMNYFKYILDVVLKPYDTFKKEEELLDFKNSGLIAIIMIGVLTIVNLIRTVISTVRVKSFWTGEVSWVWDNLGNVEFFKVIVQNILIFSGIILGISGIYFLAGLILKKETKFNKLFSVVTTSFIPLGVTLAILYPILSIVSTYLGIIIAVVGVVYSLTILVELLNETIVIENKNTKIYLHVICFSILLLAGTFIAYKLILSSITSGLGALGSLFS